jgi:purine-cytosine permease-like protein
MVAGNKLFDWPTNNTALAISMAIVAVVTILVAVYGHATLIATYKLFTILVGVFLLALIIVQIPDFDAGYSGGAYLLGTFWPTWFLSVSVGASLPISYATFGGDYSRYFSRKTVTDRSIIFWNGLGMFLSNWIALGAGAFLTTMFIDFNDAFVVGVADSIPRWFLTPFLIFAILGTWPQGALCLYGCGLSTTTISWRVAGRALTTVVLSIIGLGVVYIGTIVFDAIDSISAFVLIMNSTISPWMAIMLIGLYLRRGRYAPLDVQPYMGLESKSIYWFTYGVNLRAFTAWVPAAVIGFLFSNTTLYVGPFANAVKGIDLSYGSAFAIAAVLYFVLVKIFPERGVVPSEEAERGEIPPTAVPA